MHAAWSQPFGDLLHGAGCRLDVLHGFLLHPVHHRCCALLHLLRGCELLIDPAAEVVKLTIFTLQTM